MCFSTVTKEELVFFAQSQCLSLQWCWPVFWAADRTSVSTQHYIIVVLTCVFWPSGGTALYPPPPPPLTICCNSISGTSPHHLSDLRQPSTPTRQSWSASDTGVNTKTFGERSFSYAGPSVSNNLPQAPCHSDSVSSFKDALKTHLFLITISKLLFFLGGGGEPCRFPLSDVCVCVCVSECVRTCKWVCVLGCVWVSVCVSTVCVC